MGEPGGSDSEYCPKIVNATKRNVAAALVDIVMGEEGAETKMMDKHTTLDSRGNRRLLSLVDFQRQKVIVSTQDMALSQEVRLGSTLLLFNR